MAPAPPTDAFFRALLAERLRPAVEQDVDALAAALATSDPSVDDPGTAGRALLDAVTAAWERGWQPADVAHLVRRDVSQRGARLVTALIAAEARRSSAVRRAPAEWIEQLRDLGALAEGAPEVVPAWHRAEGRPPEESWRTVLLVAFRLRSLGRTEQLLPPPSRWDDEPGRSAAPPAPDDARLLRRIRGLLAKAESTEFPEEAEALTAKAQELMTRHAVDVATLEGDAAVAGKGVVGTRRVHLADPYIRAKVQLLGAVADANGVRLVWYQALGIATLVGMAVDLDAVELLFTSLLLQVAQALGVAESHAGSGSGARAFRRAFLLGYAHRIGERLTTAREQATAEAAAERGADLLPVLRTRQVAVDDAFADLFPRVRASRSRSSMDAGGWYAGRAAAERADVGSRHAPLR
jgi:Protein of unknown function (DUF2786)